MYITAHISSRHSVEELSPYSAEHYFFQSLIMKVTLLMPFPLDLALHGVGCGPEYGGQPGGRYGGQIARKERKVRRYELHKGAKSCASVYKIITQTPGNACMNVAPFYAVMGMAQRH